MMRKLFHKCFRATAPILYAGVFSCTLFSVTFAQTNLDFEIAEIQSQIEALQTQLKTLQSSEPSPASQPFPIPEFNKSLGLGSTGEEVKKLQELLGKSPEIYPEGLVTGYFGIRTEAAVKRFQKKYSSDILEPFGLSTATGFVGEKTLAKLNEFIAVSSAPTPIKEETISQRPQSAMPTSTPASAPTPIPTPAPAPALTPQPVSPISQPVSGGGGGGGGGSGSSGGGGGGSPPSADTTVPAAINNLAAASATTSSIVISWSAPGDDGNSGTATSYDLRYSTSSITESNWTSATQVSGEPAPQAAGSSQSMTVSGLSSATTYHFVIKTSDEVPNVSVISNASSLATNTPTPLVDTTAPASITNLSISSPTSSSLVISWSAPGDDGNSGTAAAYDIRYSTQTITENNFNSTIQIVGVPLPQVAGSSQSMTIIGLSASTAYYFAMKTLDEFPNFSAISNVVSSATTAPPVQCKTLATGKQIYFVRTSNMPQIMQVDLDPFNVQSGAAQTVSVKIRDTNNNQITTVSGIVNIDAGPINFSLSRVAGDDLNGTWQGSWSPSSSICNTYTMQINATSASGQSTIDLSFL